MKKALIIGIDAYEHAPRLSGCVNDAVAMRTVLEQQANGDPNFDVRMLNSDDMKVTSEAMVGALQGLFSGDCETALLYFAGHGTIDKLSETGHLVSQDGKKGSLGLSLVDILSAANRVHPRVKSSVIILDSCTSGALGEVPAVGNTSSPTSHIGTGVTILTACTREQSAGEVKGHGIFTGLLLDGLRGTAADIRGHISPASLYSLIDQTLGPWEQRPVYKANVDSFVTLRQVAPKIPLDVLRRLPEYFPSASHIYPLDPSYEPDRTALNPDQLSNYPENKSHQLIFKELQACNRHGLIVPVEAEHMFFAAMNSTGCRLTAVGAHYRTLAVARRI